jgi:hypothetical protein
MAHSLRGKKCSECTKASKPSVGFAEALLEFFAELRFSPLERRLFLEQSAVLWSRVPNQKRFLDCLQQFFDDAEQAGISGFKIGTYMKKRLKDKRLPELDTAINSL